MSDSTKQHSGEDEITSDLFGDKFGTRDDGEDKLHVGEGGVSGQVEVTISRSQAVNCEMQSTSTDKSYAKLTKCLMLGVAYAANIGGTATLTGTGHNVVLGGLARWSY